MRPIQKPVRILCVLAALVLTLAGCVRPTAAPAPAQPAQPTQAPPAEVTLVMVTNMDDVATLDPHHVYETTNLLIRNSTYDTLVEYRPEDLTKGVPRLAESWEVSPDGLTYTSQLRQGMRFTSGNPVTAEHGHIPSAPTSWAAMCSAA